MKSRPIAIFIIAAALSAVPAIGLGQTSASPASQAATLTPLERANADAVARLESQIVAEQLDDRTTVAQVLDRVGGRPILSNGLTEAEQVGGPRYVTQDLVQVRRRMAGSRVASLVRDAVGVKPDQSPIAPERLDAALRRWDGRSFASIGTSDTGTASSDRTQVDPPAIAIPDRPPTWARDPIGVQAHAAPAATPLRAAREAERTAREALETRIHALPLDDKHTLADLAAASPAVGDLLARAIADAPVVGVDYRADGSADVRLSLDGQRLWQAIELSR